MTVHVNCELYTCMIMPYPFELTHSLALHHSLTHSLALSLTHSLALSLTHSFPRSLTHSFPRSLALSLTHSLALSLTHSLALSLTHSLTLILSHYQFLLTHSSLVMIMYPFLMVDYQNGNPVEARQCLDLSLKYRSVTVPCSS